LATHENQMVSHYAAAFCTIVMRGFSRLHHGWARLGALFDLRRGAERLERLFLVQVCLFMDLWYS
jgi:hypothetical protein